MDKENTIPVWTVGGVVAALVIILWIATLVLLPKLIPSDAVRGQFGDMFGSINALFSGLAFVGVIVAILLQKEELEEQRNELRETRKEFKIQNETLKQQRFENTFFNMLNLHSEIVNTTTYKQDRSIYGRDARTEEGRLAFTLMLNELIEKLNSASGAVDQHSREVIEIVVEEKLENLQLYLAHYFRNLYGIFKMIHNADFTDEQKKTYGKMVRSQLSDQELGLLYYNSEHYSRGKKFKTYINEYDLFDNLPKAMVPNF